MSHQFIDYTPSPEKKVKVKTTIPQEECWWGAHLPYLGLQPVGGRRCDARPTVTFPPAEHRYQIILLGDRGTCVWTICPSHI